MAYKALYRQYRPTKFNDVVGQKIIVQTLKNSLEQNKIAHAYLFSGPRGTGKTTVAKIFARTLNCTGKNKPCGKCENCKAALNNNHPDIIEIDAASHNGVEEIRTIIDQVQYPPLMGQSKIYIIDEAHMMSTGAFNALLKTIEEPPENVIFILATTEPQKIISTILSRCQKLEFSKVSDKDLKKRIKKISEKEGIQISEEAIDLLAHLADGGVRDSLSLLDQCLAYENPVTVQTVQDVFGLVPDSKVFEILLKLESENTAEIIEDLNSLYFSGLDLRRLIERMTTLLKNSLLLEQNPKTKLINSEQKQALQDTILKISAPLRFNLLNELLELSSKMGNNQMTLERLETIFLKIGLSRQFPASVPSPERVSDHISTQISQDKNLKKPSENQISIPESSQNEVKKQPTESISEISDVSRETFMNDQDFLSLVDVDDETLIQILVNASKEEKSTDNSHWKDFKKYAITPEEMRLANSLTRTLIYASSPKTILLVTKSEANAEEINQLEETIGYSEFLKPILGKEKDLIAITRSRTKELANVFRSRRNANTLPPVNHDFRTKEKKQTSDPEEFLKSQFPVIQVVND